MSEQQTESRGPIITIGHSTHEADAFFDILRSHGIELLVDVRRFPGSRHVPWTNADALADRAERAGIAYLHLESLGGRRRPVDGSRNDGWRVAQFQGYADHLGSEEFAAGFAELQEMAESRRCAVMCSEAQWWRCHRRLLADALLLEGWQVLHADGRGHTHEHELTEFAVVEDGSLRYPRQD
jgi:uncharacterized protein (DUF488 family)